ncbi:YcgL domain-containing protein [Alteromonas sp. D210916BOD_24]|uniref:YcgL domain-containing protein n=1 Tax=Alteromonas sp. D210916BOD_24 TaxID=3157618 RepID=UPI00399D14DC
MLCAVYKTRKKSGMYLYVPKKGHFEDVPEPLMAKFGTPELVTLIMLDKRDRLAGVDKQKLEKELNEKGFYLQMPPKEDNLLERHRESLGLAKNPDKQF